MLARLCDTPVLDTPRLTLRAPRLSDFDTWHAFVLSERSRFIRTENPDIRMAWRSFAHITGMWALRGFGMFIFCEQGSDAPLGMTGPWYPMDWPEREIGWSVWTEAAEGKGYALEAATAARAYAFGTLGWTTAVSYIDPANARSIALAERMGAVLDPAATQPDAHDHVLVYRHPAPDADGSVEAYA